MGVKEKTLDLIKKLNCTYEMTNAGDYQDRIEGRMNAIEILAPDGFLFDGELSSMICFGWKDAFERLSTSTLEKGET